MIDYEYYDHEMIMTCDGYDCVNSLELIGDWQDCIEEAKSLEWKIRLEEGEWMHWCPRCWANKGAGLAFDDTTEGGDHD